MLKKGVSQVIGTVLLIAVVIVVGGIFFLGVRNSIHKSEEKALEEELCNSAKFVIGDFCYGNSNVENIKTGKSNEKTYIKFSGRNEVEEPELQGFIAIIDYGWRTVSISSLKYSEIESFGSKRITTDFIEDAQDIKQIKVIPKLKREGKVFICEKHNTEIMWEEVKQC